MPTDPISDADLGQLTSAWLLAVERATDAAHAARERERAATAARNTASKARGEERDAFEALLTYRMRARLEPTRTVAGKLEATNDTIRKAYAPTDLRDRETIDERLGYPAPIAAVGRPIRDNPQA